MSVTSCRSQPVSLCYLSPFAVENNGTPSFASFSSFEPDVILCCVCQTTQDLFVTKPMVTGGDEGTILGMVIEPSPPFYHHHHHCININ